MSGVCMGDVCECPRGSAGGCSHHAQSSPKVLVQTGVSHPGGKCGCCLLLTETEELNSGCAGGETVESPSLEVFKAQLDKLTLS